MQEQSPDANEKDDGLLREHETYNTLLNYAQSIDIRSDRRTVYYLGEEHLNETKIMQQALDKELKKQFPPATVWYAKFWRWLTGAMFQLMIQKHK